MTPNEELKIERKERSAEWISTVVVFSLGFVALVLVFLFGDDDTDPEFLLYVIGFVALGVSSYLIGRIYRKHLERKLGRELKNEYELTSLKSWMEVAKKDTSQKSSKENVRKSN